MEDNNSAVGIWIVVIGVIGLGLLFWFLFTRPTTKTLVVPTNTSTTTDTNTFVKETEKLVTPTGTPIASPSSIKN